MDNDMFCNSFDFKKRSNYQDFGTDMFHNTENKFHYQQINSSFTNRFLSVLRPFSIYRLNEINNLIYEALNNNNKEIYDCFQYLVEDLFSIEKEPNSNWNLFLLSTGSTQNEFNVLYNFLNADGDLFNLIKNMMSDASLKFEFPVSKLSAPTKILIEQGITPNFYLNKINLNSTSIYPDKLSLNPFEFYFFHFAYYIKNLNRIIEFDNNEQTNVLYLNLLDNYLTKFLPTNNNKCLNESNAINQQNSLWQSLSSTTSNLLHLGQHNITKSITGTLNTESSFIQKPSLLNIKPLQNYSFKQAEDYNQKSFDSLGSIIYKCDVIINVFNEMWLNVNMRTNLNRKKTSSTNLIKNNCPNMVYMMSVRTFIKRIHYFANSITDKSLEMANMPAFENHHQELDDVKKSVWSSKYEISKKFYSFIKLAFEHWPCDSTFKIPLETWLSFIQPWRYVDELPKNNLLINNTSLINNSIGHHQQQPINLNKWRQFIQDNILFYTTIYREIINRFINLDLLSIKNVNMLFRVTKIYSQPYLSDLIKEVESNCENVVISNSWLASASIRGSSLLSPNIRNNSQSICNKDLSFTNLLEDNEKNGFIYVSFFSDELKKNIIKLLGRIRSSINKIDKQLELNNNKQQENKNQFIEFLTFFLNNQSKQFDLEEKENVEELIKIRQSLEISKARLIQIYELDINDLENQLNENNNFDNMNINYGDGGDNINFNLNDDQSILNRDQFNQQIILNPFTKKDKIGYNGIPDLQPVRTYEFYYLVFFFIYLSDLINGYYGDIFNRLYTEDSIAGYLSRILLAKPCEYTVIEKNGQVQRRINKKLPPRINLRFLASKIFYAYLFIFILFIKIFLFSVSLTIGLLITLILGVIIFKFVNFLSN